MADRIRELLETAAATAQPREREPVAEIIRRSRAGRRRAAVAASVAAVLLVTGGSAGLVLAARDVSGLGTAATTPSPTPTTRPTSPPSSPPDTPALSPPHVVGGRIVSGPFSIAIPTGWTVVGRPFTDACVAPRTVTIGWTPNHGGPCVLDRIMSVEGPEPGQTSIGTMFTILDSPAPPVAQIALPGGAPAYVGTTYSSADPFRAGPHLRSVGLHMPWAATYLSLNVNSTDLAAMLATIRAEPLAPARLDLHKNAVAAYLVLPATTPSEPLMLDRAAAGRVRTRLASLTDVVPAGQECGSAQEPAAAVYLFPSDGATTGNDLVVITESATCTQATSAGGGRVRVPPGFIEDLRAMVVTSK